VTPAQHDLLLASRDRWLGFAFKTERCDRAGAELAVSAMYEDIAENAPRFVWFESPIAATVAAALAQRALSGGPRQPRKGSSYSNLDLAFRSALRARRNLALEALNDAVDDELDHEVVSLLHEDLRAKLSTMLRYQLDRAMRGELTRIPPAPDGHVVAAARTGLADVLPEVGDSLGCEIVQPQDPFNAFDPAADAPARLVSVWWDIPTVAYYEMAERCGVAYAHAPLRHLRHRIAFARDGGLCWPFKGLTVMCDRPIVLPEMPLGPAYESGASLTWSDGWSVRLA
jgi:hypothetical protein